MIPKIIKETLSTEGIRSKPIDLLLLNVKKTNYITKLMYSLRIKVNCKNKRSSESKLENYVVVLFKFYSHNCYFDITIRTIQIHIAATNYMYMFYLFFGIEKKEFW